MLALLEWLRRWQVRIFWGNVGHLVGRQGVMFREGVSVCAERTMNGFKIWVDD